MLVCEYLHKAKGSVNMEHGADVTFIRAADTGNPHYHQAMGLYAQSFPYHEQREPSSQAAILANPDYHFDMIFDRDVFVGLILSWQTEGFIYVEHFCIMPGLRGRGYGSRALARLGSLGKTVVLEIDPPVDAVSIRRKRFYEAAGYTANPYPHVHPPYHAGVKGHPLVVMSRPRGLSEAEYEAFRLYLNDAVMRE